MDWGAVRSGMPTPRRRRILRWVVLPAGAIGAALQLVPYGWEHDNPPVTADAPWPSDRARQLARSACYDCHSNETRWPPQSFVAPFSWLVRSDVDQGRDELNFSAWDRDGEEAGDAAEAVAEGSMPPRRYELVHPSARLSSTEARELIAALEAMDEAEDDIGDGESRDGREDRSGSDGGAG